MEPKSQWYYEKHGKAEGPIGTIELIKKIQQGELTLLDLIFKEGDSQWMPAEDFKEIANLVKTTASQFKVDADWIVLRTVEVDGRDQYEQLGPFTIDHVLQLIDKGKIKFTDFVWRNGYENWVPLGRVDEFENPLESSVQVDLSIYEKPINENAVAEVKSVKAYRASQKIKGTDKDEERPQEADGEDLAKPKWSFSRSTKKQEDVVSEEHKQVKAERPPPPPAKEKKAAVISQEESQGRADKKEKNRDEQRATAQQRWQFVASAVVVFIFLMGGSLFFVYGKKALLKFQSRSKEITIETISVNEIKKAPPSVAKPIPTPQPVAAIAPQKPVAKVEPVKSVEKVIAEKPQALTKVDQKVSTDLAADPELSQMNEKQKSYFFNQERMFLFYSAQKGVKLVSEFDKMIKKPSKKKNQQKQQMASWRKQVQALLAQVRAESKGNHLFPDFHRRLLSVSIQLDERAKDLQAQLLNARGPSKASTLVEIQAEYKKLMVQARDLD